MAIASAKVNAKQSSDRHPEGIFHKHAGMLCCTACSAPIDFEQKQSVTNILRVLCRNRSCKMLNLHWQSQAQKATNELFLCRPHHKISFLDSRGFLHLSQSTLLWKSIWKPLLQNLGGLSCLNQLGRLGGGGKAKNFESYEWPMKAVDCPWWALSFSRWGEHPGSCCTQHGSSTTLFPRGWFTGAWWGKQAIHNRDFF